LNVSLILSGLIYRLRKTKRASRKLHSSRKRKKEKLRKQQKSSSHQIRKRGRLGRKAPSPEKKKAVSENRLTSRPLISF